MSNGRLSVHSLVYYLTWVEGITWRQEDYDANKIIKIVKGESFKGYVEITISGHRRRFTEHNGADFFPVLFRAVAKKVVELVPSGILEIVPIPNSTATIADRADFKTLEHARAIAAAIGTRARAVPALRWKEQKLKAHEGGTRDPQALFEMLRLVKRPSKPVVLFDDVMTTGGQMIASYWRLAEVGIVPILGIVVGRATAQQREPVIGWQQEEIETEQKPIEWQEPFDDPLDDPCDDPF